MPQQFEAIIFIATMGHRFASPPYPLPTETDLLLTAKATNLRQLSTEYLNNQLVCTHFNITCRNKRPCLKTCVSSSARSHPATCNITEVITILKFRGEKGDQPPQHTPVFGCERTTFDNFLRYLSCKSICQILSMELFVRLLLCRVDFQVSHVGKNSCDEQEEHTPMKLKSTTRIISS